jgi:tRNA modification GTPase
VTASATSATYLACLTPPGSSAIATLALEGPDAWIMAGRLFRPVASRQQWPPANAESGRFWLGRLGENPDNTAIEVVLALVRRTPSVRVEIHCPGGIQVIRWLQQILTAQGVCWCTWQELERLSMTDPVEADALIELAKAPTLRTATILLDQWQGAFGRSLTAIAAALDRNDAAEADRLLRDLARFVPLGRHMTIPWRVAIMGPPNVGKSSLFNALAGFQRSIVTAIPGTTRDVVTTLIAVDGWPVELADTAGLRDNVPSLEEQGIHLARSTATSADLCLWVMDASGPPIWPDNSMPSVRIVINKIDLPATWDLAQVEGAVRVSVLTGFGVGDLCRALADWLVPEPPPPGAAVPFTPDSADRVLQALNHNDPGQLLRMT